MTARIVNCLSRLLLEHSIRYPNLQVQDVYKILYQAAMGSGHAIPDTKQAQFLLEEEISRLQADAHQPLVEQISPETKLERKVVRVHLRPYLATTLDMTPLLEAFVHTANTFEASIQRLEHFAALVTQIPLKADLHFSSCDFADYMSEMRDRKYPAIHHSDTYNQLYQPAYRVVAVRFLSPILAVCRLD